MKAFEIKSEYIIGLIDSCMSTKDLQYVINDVATALVQMDDKFVEKIYKKKGEEGITDLVHLHIQSKFLMENR